MLTQPPEGITEAAGWRDYPGKPGAWKRDVPFRWNGNRLTATLWLISYQTANGTRYSAGVSLPVRQTLELAEPYQLSARGDFEHAALAVAEVLRPCSAFAEEQRRRAIAIEELADGIAAGC